MPEEQQLEKVLFGEHGAYGWNKKTGTLGELFEEIAIVKAQTKELLDWKGRLVSMPAKGIYFILAALSLGTFILNLLK
jgi:hypothetical protein